MNESILALTVVVENNGVTRASGDFEEQSGGQF